MSRKKKFKLKEIRKSISNKHLGIILGLLVFVLAAGMLISMERARSQRDWLKMQAQSLSDTLSGNKNLFGKPKEYVIIPILMYHHVGPLPGKPDALRKDLTVSTENFELQLAWLKSQGYESISLNDLLQYSKGSFKLPAKPVIFTFDDGYSDVFDNAVPTLEKWGFKGSFAIITQFPGITQGTNQYATWQQIKQAQKEGMEIVSHTQDHFDGTNPHYGSNFILRNLTDSQADLKANLGSALPIMIYPYGHYNAQYIELAKQAGFEMSLTTAFGQRLDLKKMMELPRVRVHGNEDLETFKRVIQAGEKAIGENGQY